MTYDDENQIVEEARARAAERAIEAEREAIAAAYGVPQMTREELRSLRPEAIAKARAEGRLDALLGVPPKPRGEAITREMLAAMPPERILELRQSGELLHLGVHPRAER